MHPLHRKLLRDLNHMKGQVAAIAVVIAAGVLVLVLGGTTLDALSLSRDRFYETDHFAQVFADLKRAPERVGRALAEVPGVDRVQTRVRAGVRLEVPGFDEPVRGLALSIPDGAQPRLNRLALRQGGLPAPGRHDQVVISEPFAQAHDLHPGDGFTVILNGRQERLLVSGVALSPEFVYQVGPGDLLPDYRRFGVLWMNRSGLARAMDLDGAFNNVVLGLRPGVDPETVIGAVDHHLAPYGGIGAISRADQLSHRFLEDELGQLRVSATVLPVIFLGVAAFLLNVLVARVIRTQRQQVALLKAFGYDPRQLAVHYGLFTLVIVVLGVILGVILGMGAAEALAGVYAQYYRFPQMVFRLQPGVVLLGAAVALGAGLLGTAQAVVGVVRMAPAEAMRPPAPERFRAGWVDRSGLGRLLSQPSRIILRNLGRHRLKAGLSMVGIALSGSLLMVGSYQFGAVDQLLDLQYRKVLTMDLQVGFTEPTSEGVLASLRAAPGVRFAEGFRSVPVRLIHGHREERSVLLGMETHPQLRGVLDADQAPVALPPGGVLLTGYLAQSLHLSPGDILQVEVLEGHRRTRALELAGVIHEPIGTGAYMERRALNRLMGEGPALSGAWLLVDEARMEPLFDTLWRAPRIAEVSRMDVLEGRFRDYIQGTLLVMMGILLTMAGSITFAVAYNNARIAFAERSRELATLRVLGFSRGEVGWILIGEMGLITLLAIPLAWLLGTGLVIWLNQALAADLFRLPLAFTPRIYAFSAAGVLLATVLSMLLIGRRLYHLDMLSALKTTE